MAEIQSRNDEVLNQWMSMVLGEKKMGLGDIKSVAEITDRTISSQSFKLQVEEENWDEASI